MRYYNRPAAARLALIQPPGSHSFGRPLSVPLPCINTMIHVLILEPHSNHIEPYSNHVEPYSNHEEPYSNHEEPYSNHA